MESNHTFEACAGPWFVWACLAGRGDGCVCVCTSAAVGMDGLRTFWIESALILCGSLAGEWGERGVWFRWHVGEGQEVRGRVCV